MALRQSGCESPSNPENEGDRSRVKESLPQTRIGIPGACLRPGAEPPGALSNTKDSWERIKAIILNGISDMLAFYPGREMIPGWVNQALAAASGFPLETLLEMTCHQCWFQSDKPCSECPVLRCFETGRPQDSEVLQPRGRTWRVRTFPVIGESGGVEGVVKFARDITAHKKAVRKSEEKYQQLFEGLPIGIFHTTMDGRLIDANQAALRIFRCPGREQLIGLDPRRAFLNPRDNEILRLRLRAQGCLENFETRLWRWDCSIMWVNISARAIYAPNGDIVAVEGSFQDITQRKDNESRLEESEARFRGLAERSSDLIVLFDRSFKLIFWSPSTERILGYSRAELMAMRADEFMTPSQYVRVRGHVARILKNRNSESFELPMIKKDGSETIIEWTATPIHNGMEVTGIQFIGRDITIRKKAEAALRRSHEELRRLSQHLEAAREQERMAIAREVHDDLGQALTAIKFDLAWLKKKMIGADDEQVREKIDMSIKMVNDTIQSVKQIASRLRPEILNDLGLEAAMEWYLEDFSKRTGIFGRARINLSPFSAGDIPNDLCISIFRIFQEALTNVARHSSATELVVDLNYADKGLQLRVHDNGRGIDKEAIETTQSFGLAGIRERVNVLGGEMRISSLSGEGTTLKIKLPLMTGAGWPEPCPVSGQQ